MEEDGRQEEVQHISFSTSKNVRIGENSGSAGFEVPCSGSEVANLEVPAFGAAIFFGDWSCGLFQVNIEGCSAS